ncbi:MAG: MAPEG family protein [Myxococcota bacterium]
MSPSAIFAPVFATMGLTFVVWTYMYVRRIHFLQSAEIPPEDLIRPGGLAALSPAAVNNPSENLKNLFEMPVLFYTVALVAFALDRVDGVMLFLSWVFVAFRALHSVVHCTVNIVMLRFGLYLVSSLALWGAVAWLAWSAYATSA